MDDAGLLMRSERQWAAAQVRDCRPIHFMAILWDDMLVVGFIGGTVQAILHIVQRRMRAFPNRSRMHFEEAPARSADPRHAKWHAHVYETSLEAHQHRDSPGHRKRAQARDPSGMARVHAPSPWTSLNFT